MYVPDDTTWYRTALDREELARIRYIDYDYWTELSGGSRLAVDAAERIRQGIEAFGVGNGGFWYLADALKACSAGDVLVAKPIAPIPQTPMIGASADISGTGTETVPTLLIFVPESGDSSLRVPCAAN